jgi:hypothetical protein
MHRIRLSILVGALAVGLAIPLPAGAATGAANGEWHRNNYNQGEEQLSCREAAPSWTCTYLIPDGTGWFSGQNVTDSWTCPEWSPSTICDNVTAVYRGRFLVVPAGGAASPPSLVSQDYVITDVDGQAVLQLYWVDQFVCPWYRTFDEALTADFNCVPAP